MFSTSWWIEKPVASGCHLQVFILITWTIIEPWDAIGITICGWVYASPRWTSDWIKWTKNQLTWLSTPRMAHGLLVYRIGTTVTTFGHSTKCGADRIRDQIWLIKVRTAYPIRSAFCRMPAFVLLSLIRKTFLTRHLTSTNTQYCQYIMR